MSKNKALEQYQAKLAGFRQSLRDRYRQDSPRYSSLMDIRIKVKEKGRDWFFTFKNSSDEFAKFIDTLQLSSEEQKVYLETFTFYKQQAKSILPTFINQFIAPVPQKPSVEDIRTNLMTAGGELNKRGIHIMAQEETIKQMQRKLTTLSEGVETKTHLADAIPPAGTNDFTDLKAVILQQKNDLQPWFQQLHDIGKLADKLDAPYNQYYQEVVSEGVSTMANTLLPGLEFPEGMNGWEKLEILETYHDAQLQGLQSRPHKTLETLRQHTTLPAKPLDKEASSDIEPRLDHGQAPPMVG
jgi:hypothetical protein